MALTTSSQLSLTRNRYHQILIHPAPPTAQLAGVAPGTAAADRFYWSQVKGYAAVLCDGPVLEGLPVQASIATIGSVENVKQRVRTGTTVTGASSIGALATDQDGNEVSLRLMGTVTSTTFDISAGTAYNAPRVGMTVQPNASTEYALIDLDIQYDAGTT